MKLRGSDQGKKLLGSDDCKMCKGEIIDIERPK